MGLNYESCLLTFQMRIRYVVDQAKTAKGGVTDRSTLKNVSVYKTGQVRFDGDPGVLSRAGVAGVGRSPGRHYSGRSTQRTPDDRCRIPVTGDLSLNYSYL